LIVTAVLPIFILIGLGFLLKNHFSFGEGFWDTSNRLIFWAGLRFSSVKHSLGPIKWCSFLKLILLPAISGLVCLGLRLQNEATMIVVGFSSLPASASAYVMAHQMGGDAELMASILAIQTLFSVFLLSGILVYFTPL